MTTDRRPASSRASSSPTRPSSSAGASTGPSATESTPSQAGFQQPAEWEMHDSVWLAWPSHGDLWGEHLPLVQAEFKALCEAIADVDPRTGRARGERLDILTPDARARAEAETALGHLPVRFHDIPFGDIWLRDTAPLFVLDGEKNLACLRFRFNGWGKKYQLPGDAEVSARIAARARVRTFSFPWVLEGGSVEVDGEGTCLTTRQCLLNPNRNPELTRTELERGLCDALGVERVLWFGDGLSNDHTDGHVDTIARFSRPGEILLMKPANGDDPNAAILDRLAAEAREMTDARGRKLKIHFVPSPGAILDEDGEVMPASYLNFYISNTSVIVPTYGGPADEAAVKAIATCFPERRTVGLSSKAILNGGGSFHCISQQQPRRAPPPQPLTQEEDRNQ